MRTPKIGVVSLGCPKNTTDTEVMLGLLRDSGFEVTFDNDQANMCLVNTCSFIEEARRESVRTLCEMAAEGKELIITGCLAQHFKDELLKEIPEARAVIGTGDIAKIADVVRAISEDSSLRVLEVSDIPNDHQETALPRVSTGIGAYAYLKVAEGCDHNCTFCIIPMLRGRFRSRPLESLVHEARVLAATGVKEIILVSQDTTYYGLDLYGRQALPDLLEALHEIEDLHWIRIMYFYPTEASDRILETIARLPKVVKYVDIPLQHSHPAILSAMARPHDPGKVIQRIRATIGGVKIRSTFIVGFPGETEEHFESLLAFIKEHRFDRLGVFTYSRQMEVPSGHLKGQLTERVKRLRRKRLMEAQHAISSELNRQLIGAEMEVLVESFDEKGNRYVCRSPWDAPQIDNQVYVLPPDDESIMLGDFIKVRVQAAKPYDLVAVCTS